jgi:hypothetical protein
VGKKRPVHQYYSAANPFMRDIVSVVEAGGKIPDFMRQRVFHETSQETSVASVSKLLRQPREELHT